LYSYRATAAKNKLASITDFPATDASLFTPGGDHISEQEDSHDSDERECVYEVSGSSEMNHHPPLDEVEKVHHHDYHVVVTDIDINGGPSDEGPRSRSNSITSVEIPLDDVQRTKHILISSVIVDIATGESEEMPTTERMSDTVSVQANCDASNLLTELETTVTPPPSEAGYSTTSMEPNIGSVIDLDIESQSGEECEASTIEFADKMATGVLRDAIMEKDAVEELAHEIVERVLSSAVRVVIDEDIPRDITPVPTRRVTKENTRVAFIEEEREEEIPTEPPSSPEEESAPNGLSEIVTNSLQEEATKSQEVESVVTASTLTPIESVMEEQTTEVSLVAGVPEEAEATPREASPIASAPIVVQVEQQAETTPPMFSPAGSDPSSSLRRRLGPTPFQSNSGGFKPIGKINFRPMAFSPKSRAVSTDSAVVPTPEKPAREDLQVKSPPLRGVTFDSPDEPKATVVKDLPIKTEVEVTSAMQQETHQETTTATIKSNVSETQHTHLVKVCTDA